MISKKSLKALEFDKVSQKVAEYCVLYKTKELACEMMPAENFLDAKHLQERTSEAFELLYTGGVSNIEFYDEIDDIPNRASKGSTLSMGELLRVSRFLKSCRILYNSEIFRVPSYAIFSLRPLFFHILTQKKKTVK